VKVVFSSSNVPVDQISLLRVSLMSFAILEADLYNLRDVSSPVGSLNPMRWNGSCVL
jgi:hypothetical protein